MTGEAEPVTDLADRNARPVRRWAQGMEPKSPQQYRPFRVFPLLGDHRETALAAFVYKIILRDPDLARLSLYFGILYFGFSGWASLS